MPRAAACFAGLATLVLGSTLFLAGCGSIDTAPMPSSTTRLMPNPPVIYLAPFNIETCKWLVGSDRDRSGTDLLDFQHQFQANFNDQLRERLTKLAPVESRWLDNLPDHGWLVEGDFDTVFQGSRFLRAAVGAGEGQTTMQTTVYVYDLSVSKTQYLLSFRTGVPNPDTGTGAGSGSAPSGLSAVGEPITTAIGLGSGLKLDTTRTCREIAAVLSQYL
jgi:hypothetical protein